MPSTAQEKCVFVSLTHDMNAHTHGCSPVVPGDQTGSSELLLQEQVGGKECDGGRKGGEEETWCFSL